MDDKMKDDKMMKLLDFYVLRNPVVEDVYFIELKYSDCIDYCIVAMSTQYKKKASTFAFVPKDKCIRQIHVEIPFEDRSACLGKEIDKKEFKSLGINRSAVSRVWRFSDAIKCIN